MNTSIQKWGNSHAVRLPKQVIESMHLEEGNLVEVLVKDDQIIIRAATKRPQYTLKELLKGITPQNMHREVDWGAPRGKEVW